MGLVKNISLASTALGPGPDFSPPGAGKSLEFASSGESVGDESVSCEHFGNTFSIATWIKAPNVVATKDIIQVAGEPNIIYRITSVTTWQVVIRKPDLASIDKNYNTSILSAEEWHHLAITVDQSAETADQLRMYVDGIQRSPGITTDNDMASRTGYTVTTIPNCGDNFGGNIHSWAIWDKRLTSEAISAIYNGGKGNVNLLQTFGAYGFSDASSLAHWFCPDSKVPGGLSDSLKDYAVNNDGESINFANSAVGITIEDDLVEDAPGY